MSRLLAVLSLLCVLVACKPAPRDDATRIEVWHGFNAEETKVLRDIVADYEREQSARTGKKVVVDLKFVSYGDMFTKLRTAALGGMTPDVAFMDAIKVTDLAFGQALVRLDELDPFEDRYGSIEAARAEFVGASFDAGLVNRGGEVGLYGLPVQTTTVALYWNRALFRRDAEKLRAAGLDPSRAPRDWAELLAYAKVLTDEQSQSYGFGMSGSLWFLFPYLNMYGVEVVGYGPDGEAQARVNNPNGIAAMERLLSIVNSGSEGGAWKTSTLAPEAGFINEKYAMILMGPWMVENFTNAKLDFDVSLIPAPTQEEIDRLGLQPGDPALVGQLGIGAWSSSNVGGQTGVILRSCEDRIAAYEFLEYFTDEPQQRRWAESLGQIPVRLSAWDDLDTSRYPYLPAFMTQLRLAKRIPQVPLFALLERDVFNAETQLLLNGRITPEEMLANVERGMEAVVLSRVNEAVELSGE